jgi:two-component system, LytTR family, sensor kinase
MTRRFVPLLVCSLLGLVSAWQMYALPHGPGEELTLAQVMLWRFVPWQLWVIGIPLIVAARRRFPSTQLGLLASVPLHIVLFGALTVTGQVLVYLCGYLADLEPYTTYAMSSMMRSMLIKGSLSDLCLYAGVLAADAALEYRQRYRETGERLAQAQLQALKMQLHPHFLFNTLNSISVLVRKGDGPRALEMVNGMAELLRYSLRTMNVELVPVRDELDFVRRYLDIQAVRYSDRLTVAIDVDPEVMTARVPNLILQPIVENAIKHGTGQRAGASRLEIAVWRIAPDRLRIEVRDDGPGPDAAPADPADRNGVGLSHVRSRLAQLYHGRHTFALEPRTGGGMTAILELPLDQARGA